MTNPVSKIMTTVVETIAANASVGEVRAIFHEHRFHHLPVVEDDGKLVGIISRQDLEKAWDNIAHNSSGKQYAQLATDHLVAKDIMSAYPVFLEPNDEIGLAADVFLSNQVHALPVVEDECVVGIVTAHDLLRYFVTTQRGS